MERGWGASGGIVVRWDNLAKARRGFECLIQKRPRSRLTIRQRSRVLGVVSASTLMLPAGRLRFLGSLAVRHSIPQLRKLGPHKVI